MKLPHSLLARHRSCILPLFLILIAVGLRLLGLESLPYRVDGDSSRFALDGMAAWQNNIPIFGTGWMGHTNLYFYIVGVFMHSVESPLLGIRILSALGGIAGVIATYFFARKYFSQQIGNWALLALAVLPFHLVFSRNGMEVIWMTFFAPFAFLQAAKNTFRSMLLSGLVTGIAQYFAPGSRLIPILVLLIGVLQLLHKKLSFKKAIKLYSFWLLGLLIVYSPMLYYFFNNPNDYFLRINMVSIFQEGYIEQGSLPSMLLDQVIRCSLVFFFPVEGSYMWYVKTPYLDFFAICLFALGILSSLKQIKTWQIQFLIFYLTLGIILGGVLTISSPMPSRYIILFPAVAVFIAIGAVTLLNIFKKRIRITVLIAVVLALLLILESITSYLKHERYLAWEEDINTQIATYAGRYYKEHNINKDLYFVGGQIMYYDAVPTLRFLTQKDGIDINIPITDFIKNNSQIRNSVFIILPERYTELVFLQNEYKYGVSKEVKNPLGQTLFWIFEV